MRTRTDLCLLLLAMALMVTGARKGKKDRKSRPQWKSNSMPAQNKRFESVYEGKDMSLDCRAQAHNKPNVKWLKNGVELKNSKNVELKKFNLHLKALTSDMSGNYTCVVSNKHGHINWTFHLDVQVKVWPLNIEGPNNITQMVGSNIAFRCRVLNDPQATIRWKKIHSNKNTEENSLQPDFLPDDEDPHVLTLDNIQKADEGEYMCMAGNVWGLKYSSAWLTVIEPVLVPDLTRHTEMGMKKNRNNINSNNVVQHELPRQIDSGDLNESEDADMDNSVFEGGHNPEGFDYGPDGFITTKQPKNRNNRKKHSRKKDRKGKDKNIFEEEVDGTTGATPQKVQPTASVDDRYKSTYPEIWKFPDESKDNFKGIDDTRYNPANQNNPIVHPNLANQNNPIVRSNPGTTAKEESAVTENTIDSAAGEDEYIEGSISLWTIYTIVGAVGGVILLIGLVAITLTLCCKKEEGSIFKSTPV